MPVAAHELIDLFISAEIGSRLGPCLKELNLFNEPEFIIYTLRSLSSWFSGRDEKFFVGSDVDRSVCEKGLVTFLTCVHRNVVDARKLVKNTIETKSSAELHFFFG